MNSELTLNLSDLETLLSKSHCTCHIINPNKTRLILWKEEKDHQVTYYLRIGIQKFISYPLTDKNGELYWRFKVGEGKGEVNPADETKPASQATTNSPDSSALDAVTKFRQREAQVQAKLNQHAKPTPEPVNHS